MNASELADFVRRHPRLSVFEAQDVEAIADLIENPETTQVELISPVDRVIAWNVGIGPLRIDVKLTGVSNTESGVSFRFTGGFEILVNVADGCVVLDVPRSFSRFTGSVDGYLESLNDSFSETGRRVVSITKTEDLFLEIVTEPVGS
jgi:hypothetical protein